VRANERYRALYRVRPSRRLERHLLGAMAALDGALDSR
jgi:hypothetical protein